MHLICSEIDIFDCGLLWRPLLILYSKDFKSKMIQNHLCKKKTETIIHLLHCGTLLGTVLIYPLIHSGIQCRWMRSSVCLKTLRTALT